MTHPSHSEAWQHYDWNYPDFVYDPWNISLRFYANDFTPNNQFGKPYFCWHVVVMPYSLPLEMYMKDPYFFLTCIIPSPNNLKAKINVYLQLLIDELNELWCDSILTYGISKKWTIKDFPAYGILSTWMMQEKLACLKAFTLKYRGKIFFVWQS